MKGAYLLAQAAFVLFSAALVYGFTSVSKEGELKRSCTTTCLLRPQYVGASRKAPEFELKDAEGTPFRMSQYAGKTVVLNFWSTTCEPCKKELPALATLARIFEKQKDFALVTVSVDDDERDTMLQIRGILREKPPFPVLFDHGSKVVLGKFGTKLYPETWVIDARGVVRARFDGARDWTDSVMVDYLDQIRRGDYCPVEHVGEDWRGEGAQLCRSAR